MVEEPAKLCPCIFSHPRINSQAGLCLQCYIYMNSHMEWGYSSWQLLCFLQSRRGRDFFKRTPPAFLSPYEFHLRWKATPIPVPPLCSSQLTGASWGQVLLCPDRNAPDTDLSSHPWGGRVQLLAHHSPLGTLRCKQCTSVSLHPSEGSHWFQGVFIDLSII